MKLCRSLIGHLFDGYVMRYLIRCKQDQAGS